MSATLLQRLRTWERGGYRGDAHSLAVFASTDAKEAADEIDRLRAALDAIVDQWKRGGCSAALGDLIRAEATRRHGEPSEP